MGVRWEFVAGDRNKEAGLPHQSGHPTSRFNAIENRMMVRVQWLCHVALEKLARNRGVRAPRS